MTVRPGQVFWGGDRNVARVFVIVYQVDDDGTIHGVVQSRNNRYAVDASWRRRTWRRGIPEGYDLHFDPE